jgi:hypothetical protein
MTDSPSTTKGPSLAQPEQAVVNLYRNTWSELFQKFLNQQPPVGLDEAALEIHIKEMQNGLVRRIDGYVENCNS